jgi:hypothetical protein
VTDPTYYIDGLFRQGTAALARTYLGVASAASGTFSGAGSPEGVVAATVGSTYWDTIGKIFYVKDSGAGPSGWYALVG